MDTPLMASTTSSFDLLTRQQSNHFVMEDRDPRFLTWFHSVGPLSFLYVSLQSNEEGSKTLADVDAVFVLSEARCLHSDDCGEAFQLTASVDRISDGTELGCPPDPPDHATLGERNTRKLSQRSSQWNEGRENRLRRNGRLR